MLDKCLLHVAHDQQHTPFTSTVPFEWKLHTAVDCEVNKYTIQYTYYTHTIHIICDHLFLNYIQICHPKPPRAKTSPSCGPLAKQSPQKIIADIRAIAPPTECLLDDHLLASSNNPAILEQLHAVSHMPDDFTPAYGAPM